MSKEPPENTLSRCLDRKLTERRKLSPNWEIQSSYPLRENIWEYLHNNENYKWRGRRLNRKTYEAAKCCGRKTKLILLVLLCMIGVLGCLWKLCPTQSSTLLNKIIPETKLLTKSLLKTIDWKKPTVSEARCHNMKQLVLELSRQERILRNKLRLQTMMSARQEEPYIEDTFIRDLTARGGSETKELYSRSVSLWGVAPLWRASPSPNTVLSLKYPQPADCWAFSGSTGKLHVYLPYPQEVKSISVEHVKPDTAKSAPKLFELFGVLNEGSKVKVLKGEYRQDGPTKQYFRVNYDDVLKEVIFNVLSNQGNEKYTCIYRVYLYGHEYRRY